MVASKDVDQINDANGSSADPFANTAMNDSSVSLTKEDMKLAAYDKVLELLASDPNYQREVSLGNRIGFYKLGKELGAGNFSKVKLGVHVLTKGEYKLRPVCGNVGRIDNAFLEKVAVKLIEKSKMDQKAQKLLAREIQNMEEVHHPNIIRLFEVSAFCA